MRTVFTMGVLLTFALLFLFVISVDAEPSDSLEASDLAESELIEDEEATEKKKSKKHAKKGKKSHNSTKGKKKRVSCKGKSKKKCAALKKKAMSKKKCAKGAKGAKGKACKTSKEGAKAKAASAGKNANTKKEKYNMEFCMQDEGTYGNPDPSVPLRALDIMKSLGANCLRMMLYTFHMHPCRGQEGIDTLNRYLFIVSEAQKRGLKVQLVITGVGADWGSPRLNGQACAAPTGLNPKVNEYRAFIRKYAPMFTKAGVRRFSIWNEPNLGSFLCVGSGVGSDGNIDTAKCQGSTEDKQAKLYRQLYLGGWAEFNSLKKKGKVPKNVQILIGELAGAHNGARFLTKVLKAGKPLRAHGLSNHPYQYCTDPATKSFKFPSSCKRKMTGGIAWTKDFVRLSKQWAKQKKLLTPSGKNVPLYLTEFGYHQTGPYAIPQDLRAKWYPKAMDVAKKSGAKQMTIYQINPSNPGAWDTGLLDAGGNPLPAMIALKSWAKSHGYTTSD